MENNASQEKLLKILNPFISNGILNTFCITFVGLPITSLPSVFCYPVLDNFYSVQSDFW